ncbi:MAG TPA: phytanoyl-CoA dioxygenase family protein [Candidatus Sulfotelmatobacter sp.]|nr:phytanoyl-CoA dioxygenase family protein [Candidatus Sulfotelmatobacter sp.]
MAPRLARLEVAAFRRDGFVLPRGSIAPTRVARLAALAADREASAGSCAADVGACAGAPPPADPVAAWARDAGLAELVAPLLGSRGRLWRYAVLFVSPHAPPWVPWRQGGEAGPRRPSGIVSVRVALDAADPDNGCMRLLPRSHERLVREIRNAGDRRRLALPPDGVDRAITVAAVCQPGALTLYDVDTFHCEPANRSGRPRAAVAFHYVPAGSRLDELTGL